MRHVLEHVPHPFFTLSEIHRVLGRHGVLVLSVPNPYHVKEIIWNIFRIPDRQGHMYGWTRQTMTRLGEMNGFRLERSGGTYLHPPDRKSTRLNSSHGYISYSVFCLKKKKKYQHNM